MKKPREPKGGGSVKKTNQPSLPGPFCALCNGPNAHKSRILEGMRLRGLLLCESCSYRMRVFRRMTQEDCDARARSIVANLMCLILARRGYDAGLDAAVLLWNVLEP